MIFALGDAEPGRTLRAVVEVESGGAVTAQLLDSALRSLGTFPSAPGTAGSWSFRPDGGDYFLAVGGGEQASRYSAWVE